MSSGNVTVFFSTLPLSPANTLNEANAPITRATKKLFMKRFIFPFPPTSSSQQPAFPRGTLPIYFTWLVLRTGKKVALQVIYFLEVRLEIWRRVQALG